LKTDAPLYEIASQGKQGHILFDIFARYHVNCCFLGCSWDVYSCVASPLDLVGWRPRNGSCAAVASVRIYGVRISLPSRMGVFRIPFTWATWPQGFHMGDVASGTSLHALMRTDPSRTFWDASLQLKYKSPDAMRAMPTANCPTTVSRQFKCYCAGSRCIDLHAATKRQVLYKTIQSVYLGVTADIRPVPG
jgi:hypothetical protein